jgi:hypothetical protein
MILNFMTAEEFIFPHQEIFQLLPHHANYYYQWRMGVISPQLRAVSKKSVIDFINNLNSSDIEILEKYLKEKIVIQKFDNSTVKNVSLDIDETEKEMCKYFDLYKDMALSRKGKELQITFWK